MAAFAFCTHADVWMQNKHLELKQEGLFLEGKICQWNLKASISLSHLLAELETFLKLHVRQSWLKLMKWSGKQNVYLKIQISGPLANPALQAKLCILCTNCSHKTKCKNTAVSLLSTKYQELARPAINTAKASLQGSLFLPLFKRSGGCCWLYSDSLGKFVSVPVSVSNVDTLALGHFYACDLLNQQDPCTAQVQSCLWSGFLCHVNKNANMQTSLSYTNAQLKKGQRSQLLSHARIQSWVSEAQSTSH